MTMRYIIRRDSPENLEDLQGDLPDLQSKLGEADKGLLKTFDHRISTLRHIQYSFATRKTPSGWAWVCPSVELVAEDEEGLFELTRRFGAPKPSHLAHVGEPSAP